MTKKLEWEKARCPVCGGIHRYIKGGYKPSTCNSFDCIYRWFYDPKFKIERKYGKGVIDADTKD